MAEQKVNIKVSTSGAEKSKSQLGGVSGSIRKLGSAIVATSAAYFGTRGLIKAISISTELAGIQEQAEKKLEVALGRRSQALLDQASALQKVTTFGDESIIGVQASLAAFIDSEEAIKKATVATLDIAVAMGMDLKAAGDLVAKTLGSSTNAMSRYGIQVEGAVGSTERLESLTNNVAELFGGQASAQADTYAGKVQQLENELGDMAEGIGRLLIPAFEKLAPHISNAIKFYSDLFDIQEKYNNQTSGTSIELEKMNSLLDFQRQRLEGLTTANLFDQRHTENGLQLAKRARAEGNSILEQYKIEKQALGELTAERFNLIQSEKQLEEIRKAESELQPVLTDIRRSDIEMNIKGVEVNEIAKRSFLDAMKARIDISKEDLKLAALQQGSAKDAMKAVVRAETMEAVAGYISSVLKNVPFPANLVLAAGGGALVSGLIDKGLSGFADGGIVPGSGNTDSVPAMLTPGEVILNAAQQDNLVGGMGNNITVNISAPLVDDTVVESIIPAIQTALNEDRATLKV